MLKRSSILFGILYFFVFSVFVSAQSVKDLKQKKTNTQNEIELTTKLLNETESDRKSSLHEILLIERNIFLREKLLTDIDKQINYLQIKIEDNTIVIESLEADLNKIKEEYSRIIYHSYINSKFQNSFMYILSSESFNQAYKRLKYIQYYTRFRNKQVQLINVIHQTLYDQLLAIERQIEDKKILLQEKQNESVNLAKQKAKKEIYVSQLNIKEETLKKQLADQKRIADKLEEEIIRMIAAETKSSDNNIIALTPEERLTSTDFRNNMGSLPWPTEYGVIIRPFGINDHPILKGNKLYNNGIDISTKEGSIARALFDGEVRRVSLILGANYFVLIKHGNFYSVYENLVDVTVEAGQKVKVKQPIGTVFTDKKTNSTVLHFEIWEEFDKLNPEVWLSSLDKS